jgi:hypothetical protein
MRLVMRPKDSRLVPQVLEVARDAVSLFEPRASCDLLAFQNLGIFLPLGFPCCSVVPGKETRVLFWC